MTRRPGTIIHFWAKLPLLCWRPMWMSPFKGHLWSRPSSLPSVCYLGSALLPVLLRAGWHIRLEAFSLTLHRRFVPRRLVTLYLASPPSATHESVRQTDRRTVSGTVKRRALSIVPLSSKGEDSCYRMAAWKCYREPSMPRHSTIQQNALILSNPKKLCR